MSKKIIVNGNEIIEREMNADELAQQAIDKANVDAYLASILEETSKAEADKAALLAKLGITADEAKLLLS